MPVYGRLAEDRLPHASPIPAPLYPPPPWPLKNARLLKLVFETSEDAVLEWIPPKLTRSTPPYATIIVASYPDSPIGPFNVATQYAGCRAGFFIRAFALESIVDNPAAMAALREVWGLPCKLGEVAIDRSDGAVTARVSRDGSLLATIALVGAHPIDSSSARFDPVLTVRTTPSIEEGKRHDLLQLVQIDPDYEIAECLRGTGAVEYGPHRDTDPWDGVPMLNMIAATDCLVNTEMPLARYVMPY
jgi:acetoacetate decarboxylase